MTFPPYSFHQPIQLCSATHLHPFYSQIGLKHYDTFNPGVGGNGSEMTLNADGKKEKLR